MEERWLSSRNRNRGRTCRICSVSGLVGKFKGYFPGYSELVAARPQLSELGGLESPYPQQRADSNLRSANPRETPKINFRYFDEGNDKAGEDLDAVVEGIKFVRAMTSDLKKEGLIAEEELPGDHIQSDEALREFVRNNAWGHHASCTCPIGPKETGGVLSSDFRSMGPKVCGSSTLLFSRAFPVFSSSARFT